LLFKSSDNFTLTSPEALEKQIKDAASQFYVKYGGDWATQLKVSHIVYATISIDGNEVLNDSHFTLTLHQKMADHDRFEISCFAEAFGDRDAYPMNHSRQFLGKKNTEKPVSLGAMFNGEAKSGHGGKGNYMKGLQTASGNKLLMNDQKGSVLLEDSSKSFLEMNGQRKIEVNADVFEINVKKMIINASQSTEIVTQDYILNALSKIYIFSNWMKQSINGFMHLFSNKALINSTHTIDIEAKNAMLHGTEKTLLHSDKTIVVNSKGLTEIRGKHGVRQTNKAKKSNTTIIEEIALTKVYFRPLKTWNGEFGFDWLREHDNGLIHSEDPDPDYESIIESGYKDGVSDLSDKEAFEKLKNQYQRIPIKKKDDKASNNESSDGEYFVPYLSLFSKEFVENSLSDVNYKPKYESELQIFVEIDEDIDKLEFDYDKNLFTLDKIPLQDKGKTNGFIYSTDATIKITCLKDLDSDKEIKIYAYQKNSAQPIIDRKLAGKIIVLQNDKKKKKSLC
jgi:type VI secretion system secreted protein VgrG